MKKLIVLFPKGTEKLKVDHMCNFLREANPEAKVTRKLDQSSKSFGLLIIDKRRGME